MADQTIYVKRNVYSLMIKKPNAWQLLLQKDNYLKTNDILTVIETLQDGTITSRKTTGTTRFLEGQQFEPENRTQQFYYIYKLIHTSKSFIMFVQGAAANADITVPGIVMGVSTLVTVYTVGTVLIKGSVAGNSVVKDATLNTSEIAATCTITANNVIRSTQNTLGKVLFVTWDI